MTKLRAHLRRGVLALAAATLGLAAAFTGLPAEPAHAAAAVNVSGTPAADRETTIQVSGSGFQSVQGGFGGIYVLFGWVDDPTGGSWRPSNGGVTGTNLRYVYDDESAPVGFQLFVAFPGSSTGYAANGGEIAADGTWSGALRIPGAVLQTYDRDNNATTVDCRSVQCGVITIGAHGVKNANNESFTPVSFATGAAGAGADAQTGSGDAQTPTSAADTPAADAAATSDTSAAPVATSAPVVPVATTAQPLLPDWFLVLVPALLIAGLSLLALAVGAGAYLAAKSLLLGVNPEALEKVRGQRERRALRERERQRRRTAALRLAQERRTARAMARVGGRATRGTLLDTAPESAAARPTRSRIDAFFGAEPPVPGTVDGRATASDPARADGGPTVAASPVAASSVASARANGTSEPPGEGATDAGEAPTLVLATARGEGGAR